MKGLVVVLLFLATIAYGVWALLAVTSAARATSPTSQVGFGPPPSVEAVSWLPSSPEMVHWAVTGEAPRSLFEAKSVGHITDCVVPSCAVGPRVTRGSHRCWCAD